MMVKINSFQGDRKLCHTRKSGHSDYRRDQPLKKWIPVFTGMTQGYSGFERLRLRVVVLLATILFISSTLYAAPKSDLWPRWQKHDAASTEKIDHEVWNRLLRRYLISPHPSGINRFRYATVASEDRVALKGYLQRLQGVAISLYNRAEQRAYWINLYNAQTVELILSRYPVRSIRDINISPGFFTSGPWGAKLLSIEGEKLSLDDVEHRILRPIWQDNRIHYALNCASLGCPNLQPEAFTGVNTDSLLEKGAREFINHPRGVTINNGKLRVSSIYVWFQEDFGSSAEGLLEHWGRYATGALANALNSYSGGLTHDYDWLLNGTEPGAQKQ